MVIVILGVDGAGKSTLIKSIMNSFSDSNISIKHFHFMPKVYNAQSESQVKAEIQRSSYATWLQHLKVVYLVIKFLVLERLNLGTDTVVYDRHILDILIDSSRYRLEYRVVRHYRRIIEWLARYDRLIVVVGDTKEIYTRNRENSYELLVDLMGKYVIVANRYNAYIYDGTKNLETELKLALNYLEKG